MPEFRVSMAISTDALDKLYKQLKPKGVTMTALLAKVRARWALGPGAWVLGVGLAGAGCDGWVWV